MFRAHTKLWLTTLWKNFLLPTLYFLPTESHITQVFDRFYNFSRLKSYCVGKADSPALSKVWFKHRTCKRDIDVANVEQHKWSAGLTRAWNYTSDHTDHHSSFKKLLFLSALSWALLHKFQMKSNAPGRHGRNRNSFGTEKICPDFAGWFLHLWEGAGDYTIWLWYSKYCKWIK